VKKKALVVTSVLILLLSGAALCAWYFQWLPLGLLASMNKRPAFVTACDLRKLVNAGKPAGLEIRFVAFEDSAKSGPSKSETSKDETPKDKGKGKQPKPEKVYKNIEFELTADDETRSKFLYSLEKMFDAAIRKWQSNAVIEVKAFVEDKSESEGLEIRYKAQRASGLNQGTIHMTIARVPDENLKESEEGQIIHSLIVQLKEDHWPQQ
jgi:hypothetical protein